MNIILIVFDSLRKDCLGVYGSSPWGKVHTPNFDTFSRESLMMMRAYPESLPTLPARRALYTGQRVYPFHNADFRHKGDFVGAPGWGPIPESQPTLAELLKENGYRTALIADVYHLFKPSKNYWRGFDQWMFLRGQETDPQRSGPRLTQGQIDYWLPKGLQNESTVSFIEQCIMNKHDRTKEEDYLAARVLKESALWLEQNQDADKFFLTVESFAPHEPWLVPANYRRMYSREEGQEQVISAYADVSKMPKELLTRTQANYSGMVTLCDRWFGYFMESMRVLGLLENTMVILTTDHGHSIGDNNYMGKRGYPSAPEVLGVPIIIRHPEGKGAGTKSDIFVQHTDITATILKVAGVEPPFSLDGKPFLDDAIKGKPGVRDHVTVGWGAAHTVITDKWWYNSKADGKGCLLYDLKAQKPFEKNVTNENPKIVEALFALALEDAGGAYPEWIIDLAKNQLDAPGCSDLATRG